MNKTMLIIGAMALILSGVLFVFDYDFFNGVIGSVNVSVYLGWFFALLGALLVITSIWRRTTSK